ncbi:MAG: serine hydrolase domain-containing protein [Terriglobales bacterium]
MQQTRATSRRDFLLASTAVVTSGLLGAQTNKRTPCAKSSLNSLQRELRSQIPALMGRHNVPGISLSLVRDREIVWADAFGFSDRETKVKLHPQTVFEAASLSKPAFSYVVLRLVEQGRFQLQRPLVDYVGRDVAPDEPRFKQITAFHVLTHTSGIEGVPAKERPPKLEFSPGERFQYSPHAFDFLQLAVEQATGEELAPVMERMLLRPLHMSVSAFDWSEAYAQTGARGYDDKGKRGETINERVWRMSKEERAAFLAPYSANKFPNAAASLHSTPSDYARFLVAAMRPSADAMHLDHGMHAEMLKPHVSVRQFDDLFWGLGFGLQRPKSGPASFWHWGDWGIFQHYAVAYPEEGSAFVIMTNSGNGLRVGEVIAPRALGHPQPAFAWLMS